MEIFDNLCSILLMCSALATSGGPIAKSPLPSALSFAIKRGPWANL